MTGLIVVLNGRKGRGIIAKPGLANGTTSGGRP